MDGQTVAANSRTDARPDDDAWNERCAFWLSASENAGPKRKKRERNETPLVLVGQGMSIRIEKGALLIRDGNTHYPSDVRTHRFFKGALDIPPRIVVVDGSGEITFDALDWMREQGVALIRLNWRGEVISVASPSGSAFDFEKVRWQHETRADPNARAAFASDLVAKKVRASIDVLRDQFADTPARRRALAEADAVLAALDARAPETVSVVLGLEGRAATAYFRVWRGLAITWKGTARHPIPDDWHSFGSRSSLTTGMKAKNRNASHPVNAMLNYAYGMLESQTKLRAIADGYDPTVGIVHEPYRDRAALALDLMEPERPRVDAAVLEMVRETTFSPGDFTLRADGVCRVNPELARRVVQVIHCTGIDSGSSDS